MDEKMKDKERPMLSIILAKVKKDKEAPMEEPKKDEFKEEGKRAAGDELLSAIENKDPMAVYEAICSMLELENEYSDEEESVEEPKPEMSKQPE